jgi:hypothetical protein
MRRPVNVDYTDYTPPEMAIPLPSGLRSENKSRQIYARPRRRRLSSDLKIGAWELTIVSLKQKNIPKAARFPLVAG